MRLLGTIVSHVAEDALHDYLARLAPDIRPVVIDALERERTLSGADAEYWRYVFGVEGG